MKNEVINLRLLAACIPRLSEARFGLFAPGKYGNDLASRSSDKSLLTGAVCVPARGSVRMKDRTDLET